MNLQHARKARISRRRWADKLILALWLLGALFAAYMLVRAEGTTEFSTRQASEEVRV